MAGGKDYSGCVCGELYKHTPPKNADGGGIFTTSGSISRITRIMLTYEVNEINDLADSGMILTGFG